MYLIALAALATLVTFWQVETAGSEYATLLLKTTATGRLIRQLQKQRLKLLHASNFNI